MDQAYDTKYKRSTKKHCQKMKLGYGVGLSLLWRIGAIRQMKRLPENVKKKHK